MKKLNYLIILVILLNKLKLIQSEELLELNCFNETQCKQFQHSGINTNCVEHHCQCTTATGERVKCQPMINKLNNIIGGPCPCQQPNAECVTEQDICYCVSNYMPSSDKRRCIKKIAMLGEECEQDLQCQRSDYNAICHPDSKKCLCMEQFINDEGKCASIVGNKSICSTDSQCLEQYGANTKCTNTTQHCVCASGYFVSVDNLKCLEIAKYLEKCSENIQCLGSMGLGGKCIDNVCQCSEKYYVEEKKVANDSLVTICTAFVERGQYCRYNEDCYQRQLNETDQSMNCIYGECDCRMGYNSYNDGECVRGGGSELMSKINLYITISGLVFVNIILKKSY